MVKFLPLGQSRLELQPGKLAFAAPVNQVRARAGVPFSGTNVQSAQAALRADNLHVQRAPSKSCALGV